MLMQLLQKSKRDNSKRKIWYKDINSAEAIGTEILRTEFTQCGYFLITRNDIGRYNNRKCVTNIPCGSLVSDTVKVTTKLKDLTLRSKASGFLTTAMRNPAGYFTWERRWCTLDGTTMKIWNTPLDVDFNHAVEIVDFKKCAFLAVRSASRQFCPKTKTLVLEIAFSGRGNGVQQYFLNADNASDYEMWNNGLNEVVAFLNSWKVFCNDGII